MDFSLFEYLKIEGILEQLWNRFVRMKIIDIPAINEKGNAGKICSFCISVHDNSPYI